ncbi:MAG: hypothetical protein KKB90_07965 [Actinobacteria bacterium]|nr:hypothetical protein [Actinomycetota bacterium]MCG2819334.1 hypothetical protein [Actinomycetes bacterium]MBU4218883.1 hypothetical protein [Actinomycetota bacterium]MBU4358862.1 hypothetical protein [Actinomycetota bacterium]MBU4392247.1 hypothetical protein [Actinomycetota bacterium]
MGKGKPPSFQFYVNDYLGSKIMGCCSASRGIWICFLCHMWSSEQRGILVGTLKELQSLGHCTKKELLTLLDENMRLNFAIVESHIDDENHSSPAIYTITSRRMVRDEIKRQKWAEEKRKQREKEQEEG